MATVAATRLGLRLPAASPRALVLHLPEDHPALATQCLLLEAIHAGQARFGIYTRDPLPIAAALADARALARRILNYATPAELAAVPPADLLAGQQRPPGKRRNRTPKRSTILV